MIHEPLSLHLRADVPLQAIIGQGAAARYFEGVLPQKSPSGKARIPAVLVRSIDINDRQVTFCGTVGTKRAVAMIDCYDATARDAWAVAAGVREALLDFRGIMGGTLKVRACTLDLEVELDDPEPGLYRIRQSWAIWFME